MKFLGCDFFALFERFFEHRIFDDLLIDHFLQLKPVELKHRDHLYEPRSQNLLLRDLQLQSGR